jgi:hypothetical protein
MPETKPPAKNRRSGERRGTPRPTPGSAVWYVLGFLLLLALAQAFFFQIQSGEAVSYSDFKAAVRADKVQEVVLSEERVRGVYKPVGSEKGKPFMAVRVEDAKLPEELEAHGILLEDGFELRLLFHQDCVSRKSPQSTPRAQKNNR